MICGKPNARLHFAVSCIATVLIVFGQQSLAQQSQKGKQPQKAATAKKKIGPADLSVLTAFKDALLDLKGAVEVGVNRQDFQRKLQTATGEGLKAEDRLPDDEDKPGIVRRCFNSYSHALSQYKIAAIKWDLLLWLRERSIHPPGHEDRISEAEADLQTSWRDADHALDEARTCTSPPKPD